MPRTKIATIFPPRLAEFRSVPPAGIPGPGTACGYVRELARQVSQPTLVLHARDELRIPFEEGRLTAATIPNARLITLESKNHILLEKEPAWQRFLEEVNTFKGMSHIHFLLFKITQTRYEELIRSILFSRI